MTDIDLDAVEARAVAATEGPWHTSQEGLTHPNGYDIRAVGDGSMIASDGEGYRGSIADSSDAEFIAHARTDVPALLAALREREVGIDGYDTLMTRMGDLLSRAAGALNGPPPPLTSWGYHNVPELAEASVARVRELEAALRERDATIARVRDAVDNSPIYRPDHATYGDDAWDNIETVDLARILRALDPQEGQ